MKRMRLLAVTMAAITLVAAIWSVSSAKKVYWSREGIISRANLDGTEVETVVQPFSSGTIDFDEVERKIYWIDPATPKIQRANEDGTDIEDLVTAGLNVPRGIDVDEVGRKLYWTDRQADRIQRSELDGSNVVTIISGIDRAQGIQVEPVDGKIYWSQDGIGHPGYICRANLDGTGIETLISANMDPEDIAVDRSGGKIYWTGNRLIRRINLDGSDLEHLVDTGDTLPFGIDVDPIGKKVYWGLAGPNKVQRANLDGTGVEDVTTGVSAVQHVALDLSDQPTTVEETTWGRIKAGYR